MFSTPAFCSGKGLTLYQHVKALILITPMWNMSPVTRCCYFEQDTSVVANFLCSSVISTILYKNNIFIDSLWHQQWEIHGKENMIWVIYSKCILWLHQRTPNGKISCGRPPRSPQGERETPSIPSPGITKKGASLRQCKRHFAPSNWLVYNIKWQTTSLATPLSLL